jgi:DNA-binding CsgD family transcriptional regulator
LAVALGDMATWDEVTRIGVCPLSRRAVEVLTAGSGVNADELHRLTGGNAFFVSEVLAAGRDGLRDNTLPRSVSEAVWGRLGRLSAAARDTTYAAAVCGPWIDPGVLTAVCPAAAIDDCLGAGVLVTDGAAVGFRHELARRATLDRIPEPQRRRLHARALVALSQEPVPPETLGALAFHAEQAGDEEAVVRYGVAGAEQAAALGANRQAANLYASVLHHAHAASNEQKVEWLERHAFASYLSGSAETAARSWRKAITLRHQMGNKLEEADDLRWLSMILWPLGHLTEATGAGRAAVRLLEELGPSRELAWALVNLAQLAVDTYDPGCEGYAARAITLGNELGEPAVVLRARFYAAAATVLRSDTGWDRCEAAWRDAMATDGLAEHAGLLGAMICWTAVLHYQLGRAQRYIADTAAFCADRDLGMFQPLAVAADGLVALHRGDWNRAAALAEDVLTGPGPNPLHRMLPLITRALVDARRGRGSVGPLLDEALGCTEPDDFFRLGPVWAARAEVAWLAGDDDTARAEAHNGLASAGVTADPWLVGHLRRWAQLAGSPLAGVVDTVTPFRFEVSGEWQAAAAEWTRLGCPYDAAVAQLGGDIDAVQAALTTFRGLGARAAARRAQQRLAQLRGRTPSERRADTLADPHRLTRRQRDVLELIVAGHSDSDIATKLCISPRTVAHHVEAILTKLGVNNRTQAAAVYKGETTAGGRRPK